MGKLTEKITFGLAPLPAGLTLRDPVALIATWFGSGLLRPAPGTMGSLAAIPLGYAINRFLGQEALLLAIVVLMIIGTRMADAYGKKSGVVDDQSIVVDEVVGLWIAALPSKLFGLWIVAFLLFRLFDVWKPWPASFYDNRSKSGFDVMMDDVVAGVYAFMGVCIGALMFRS